MINLYEVTETNKMIEEENLDVRTITLGISLLDCIDSDLDRLNEKIYNKIYKIEKEQFFSTRLYIILIYIHIFILNIILHRK